MVRLDARDRCQYFLVRPTAAAHLSNNQRLLLLLLLLEYQFFFITSCVVPPDLETILAGHVVDVRKLATVADTVAVLE